MTDGGQTSQSGWLEVIGQFSQVEKLLDAFAVRSGLMPEGAYRTQDPGALPENLRRLWSQSMAHVSVCFAHGARSWVFTGAVCASLSRERNTPVLWVNAYNHEGILIDAGAWALERDGTWRRCGDHVDI